MSDAPLSGMRAASTLHIPGVVSCLPERRIDNSFFKERFGEAAVHDVVKMIGVESRYWADGGTTTADLCFEAALRLLEGIHWPRETIDGLIFVTQTPDFRLPATACVLHGRLGLKPGCIALDVNLGCSGYVYGLWLASSLLQGGCKRIVLLVGDTISKITDPSDRATAMLFGDAGTATALERGGADNEISFVLGTDGAGACNLMVPEGGYRPWPGSDSRMDGRDPSCLFMDGGEIFNFTLQAVPRLIDDAIAMHGCAKEDIDAFLLHQANLFMLKHLAKKAKIPVDRLLINIDEYGNTSSASIPLLLTTRCPKSEQSKPARFLLAGFGVGYSWASAIASIQPGIYLETVTL